MDTETNAHLIFQKTYNEASFYYLLEGNKYHKINTIRTSMSETNN